MNILFWDVPHTKPSKLAYSTFNNLYQLCHQQNELSCHKVDHLSPRDKEAPDLIVMSSWSPVFSPKPILLCAPPEHSSKRKKFIWKGLSKLQSISLVYPYLIDLPIAQFTLPPLLNISVPSTPLGSAILAIGPL